MNETGIKKKSVHNNKFTSQSSSKDRKISSFLQSKYEKDPGLFFKKTDKKLETSPGNFYLCDSNKRGLRAVEGNNIRVTEKTEGISSDRLFQPHLKIINNVPEKNYFKPLQGRSQNILPNVFNNSSISYNEANSDSHYHFSPQMNDTSSGQYGHRRYKSQVVSQALLVKSNADAFNPYYTGMKRRAIVRNNYNESLKTFYKNKSNYGN